MDALTTPAGPVTPGVLARRLAGLEAGPVPAARRYHLARFVLLRLLGVVYLVAFVILVRQGPALLGSHGLLPIAEFTARVSERLGSSSAAFAQLPSLFWFGAGDSLVFGLAWCGAALSLLVFAGVTNAVLLAVLWVLYLSFVHVGQDWYGYGWEIQLLETGFLAIFLAPVADWRPFPASRPAPLVIALMRWLIFRIMLGAGLIKLRGDSCWRDLTCLEYHYETQPVPNPFSRTLHFAPHALAKAGVVFNHVTEVGMPWLLAAGRRATCLAGVFFVAFQAVLIASGNLSFLNWLTIVPALACFDDAFLARLLPARLVEAAGRAEDAAAAKAASSAGAGALLRGGSVFVVAAMVAWLSVPVMRNLVSGRQVMNTSFGALDLVNTYGAFGSVGRERRAIVFEGTTSADPSAADTVWKEYELPCAPGDPSRRPCVISPYHDRLDWQVWFAAMSTPSRYPWSLRLVWKLLHHDELALSLFDGDPFSGSAPRYVRVRLYRYRFAPPGSGRWWDRDLLGDWIPPLSADDARLTDFLEQRGWVDRSSTGDPAPGVAHRE